MLIEKLLYRARVKATVGRDTPAVPSDGVLDLNVTTPRELGGTNGRGQQYPRRMHCESTDLSSTLFQPGIYYVYSECIQSFVEGIAQLARRTHRVRRR
ncbi:MAG TPA: hypothetical protein VGD54_05130 [Steroidobacteraceae bacterium]